jgi:hypothetical protein
MPKSTTIGKARPYSVENLKYFPPPPPPPVPQTIADVVWGLSHKGITSPFVDRNPAYLVAIDVTNKLNPVLLSDTLMSDMDNLYWPYHYVAGGIDWARPHQLHVDANYMYYFSTVSGHITVRSTNTTNPAIVNRFYEAVSSPNLIRYKTNSLIGTAIYGGNNVGIHKFDITNPLSISRTTSAGGLAGYDVYINSSNESAISEAGAFYTPETGHTAKFSTVDPGTGSWSWQVRTSVPNTWYLDQRSVVTKGTYMYVFEMETSGAFRRMIQTVDLTTDTVVSTVFLSVAEHSPNQTSCQRLWIDGNYLIVFVNEVAPAAEKAIFVYSLTDPTTPARVAQYKLSDLGPTGGFSRNYAVCRDGSYLYLAMGNESAIFTYRRNFIIYNISDWLNVTFVSLLVMDSSNLPDVPSFSALGCYPNGNLSGGNYEVP